ncbi:BREX-1 system adenine-specific DNA-methyltransferase PglX [Clostridium sp. SYSU_GA19001]|uniref:BREX-1 system adenine-specific DNA-methyltransferase PglX n=1 Tax=Clostridium caldaquaticum TaxID=2940653 RepID=UPI00207753D3|nr:BREX-1 system adenine-specific DNA-methyltransferase PglX [Clostridium caldaquaticum]MCM8711319.1 BREX-1 system adenine-specific DNA-methyltransferase PglX [Clostridium caldaquaticum]
MNKAALKSFAIWGRKKLKDEILDSAKEAKMLIETEELDKITYKWFIKFILLRYLEVKSYINNGISTFYKETNHENNEILQNICRELNCIFPEIFQANIKTREILLLKKSFEKKSFTHRLLTEIGEEPFETVEIIGWFHQFYNSSEHDIIVGMNNGIISGENIPAATQLFTPRWIVEYMIDNSLGKLWVEGKNDLVLKEKLKYYIENRKIDINILNKQMDLYRNLKPEEIKFLDPACGCGHILIYAFDVLYQIYLNCGYKKEEIPKLIIEKNLFGLDIDNNVIVLTQAALILKAREKDSCFFEKLRENNLNSNIIQVKSTEKILEYSQLLLQGIEKIDYSKEQIDSLFTSFNYGHIIGSLAYIKNFDLNFWKDRLRFIDKTYYSEEYNEFRENMHYLVKQAQIISQTYHIVCTNPPYMSKKYMDYKLKKFIKDNYLDFNGDLFSVFMIRNLKYTKPYGYSAFMTPFVWMFIKEYEKLRKFIIDKKEIVSLIQLEYSAFTDATVPICTFILGNFHGSYFGEYIKLSDFKGEEMQPVKTLQAIKNPQIYFRYNCSAERYKKIPGMPIAYWISENFLNVFSHSKKLENFIDITGSQNITSNNDKYLRKHWEIDKNNINKRWFFYTKGGDYRKWYGNIEYLVDWSEEARQFYKSNKTSNLLSDEYCFREGITYNSISTKGFSAREAGKNIYDKSGPTFHLLDDSLKYYVLALLNSKVIAAIMQLYNPTINYQVQDIKNIPVILTKDKFLRERIDKLCKECIELSKEDWDCKEISYSFYCHSLLKCKGSEGSMEEAVRDLDKILNIRFNLLKEKEEELNRIFINIYNLKNEITPYIKDSDLTISKINRSEQVKSFISYGVGCIMGRYMLKEGESIKSNDGILPLKDEYIFNNTIAYKFIDFLGSCFGKARLHENLNFIAEVLGKKQNESSVDALKRYFLKDFYKDHLKTYKKRPIYWLFTSGEKMAFSALVYMNKLNINTLKILRTEYVLPLIEKEKKDLLSFKINSSSKKIRCIKNIETKLEELGNYYNLLEEYEKKGLDIDLDNGITYNYSKIHDLLHKI